MVRVASLRQGVFYPNDAVRRTACEAAIFGLLVALALAAVPVTASAESPALADPFGDRFSLAVPQPSPSPSILPTARRYAARANRTLDEIAPREPRWRPFRWLSQETGWFAPANPRPALLLSVVDAPAGAQPQYARPSGAWTGPAPVLIPPAPNSWLAYPLYVEKFAGGFLADEPIENRLHNGVGFVAGVRTGWDYAEHWGVESRLAFARTALGGPTPQTAAHENFVIWDAMWLWYPIADGDWRPFLLAGPGLTAVRFIDDHSVRLERTFFHVPIGFGIKHKFGKQHAFRFDVTDNLLFGEINPRELKHQIAIVGGFEFRFGNPFPW